MHSLAFGTLRPYVDHKAPNEALSRSQLEMTMDVINPATEGVIAVASRASAAQLETAIAAAT